MLVIPTGTDAPIYHWPRVTVGLIVLNVVLAVLVPPRDSEPVLNDDDEVVAVKVSAFDRYALALGDGLHPVQWVTHNFLHYGFLHLAGNMLFLWAFGIVVEGKLGPVKYLLTYLAVGTLHGAFVQILMLRAGQDGHAAGASAMVYGLLAVCMVWAPRNELNCTAIMTFGFRIWVWQWDLYYTTVALFYIGQEVFWMLLYGAAGRLVVSETGHLSGALWGTVIAVVVLKAGWVDCEGWDLFSLWSKRRRLASDWKKRGELLDHNKNVTRKAVKARHREPSDAPAEDRSAAALRRVRERIDDGDHAGALAAYDRGVRTIPSWPSRDDLYGLIKAMHAAKAESESVRLMRDHCRLYPADSPRVRIKLAQILIRDRQRPGEALRVLHGLPSGSLPPDLEAARRKLVEKAEAMQEEGVLELQEDD